MYRLYRFRAMEYSVCTGCTGLEQWSTVYVPVGTDLEQWNKAYVPYVPV